MSDRNRSDLLGRRDDSSNESFVADPPYPWEKHFDDEYQSYYYFNPQTQETQWAAVNEQAPFVPNEVYYEDSSAYERDDPYEFNDEYSLNELDGDSISNMSRLSQLSVLERSEHMLAVKREKQENLRQQLLQREEEEIRDPEINKRSKQLNRNVDDIFAWEEQRKARIDALTAQQRAAEAAQNTGKPTLYASSSASVSSYNSSGSAANMPVEARLHAYEEKRKLKLQQTIAAEKNEARRAAIPTIAPHSANLVQRRVAAQARGEDAPQLSNRQVAAGDTPGILRDNSTGQIYFQPKLNRKSEQLASQSRPQMPIEDLLADKGRLQQQKQVERERRLDQRAAEMRQISKVNPRSELLVQERYILQGETTQDRLARPIGQVKQKTLEEIEKPTFKPTLNPVSIEMTLNNGYNIYGVDSRQHNNHSGGSSGDGPYSPQEEALARFNSMYSADEYSVDHGEPLLYEDFVRAKHHGSNNNNNSNGSYMYDSSQSLAPQDAMYSKTQRWNEMRNQKLEKERRERERKEAEICTFKPKIEASARSSRGNSSHNNSFSDNNNNNNGYEEEQEGAGSIDAYLERQLSWVEKRDQKLEQERRKAAQREVADCSFAPKLIVNPHISVPGSSVVARVGVNGAAVGSGGVKPTNTTFGSNIYTNNSNNPVGVQNVRRGGAGVAKVAYNANKARQGQYQEGPYYASDDITTNNTKNTNKYYNSNSTYYEQQQEESFEQQYSSDDEVAPPPPASAAPTQTISSGRIPLPLPAKVPISRQTTQPSTQPAVQHASSRPAPQSISSLHDYHQDNYSQYDDEEERGQEQSQYSPEEDQRYAAPARIKVPLPAKAITSHTTVADMSPRTAARKNVHFSAHSDDTDRNYTTHEAHEVTVDYSDSSDGGGLGSPESPQYNGLPFQVTRPVGAGDKYSGSRSPDSSQASLPHQLFPPTPHQLSQSGGVRPAPYATNPTKPSSYTFSSFVEPTEDHDYGNVNLFDVSRPSPPSSSGGRPARPAAPPAPHQRRVPVYEDLDSSPPPPPPVVFRENPPRTSSNAPVVITGRVQGGGVGGRVPTIGGTPHGAASRDVNELRSPEEDWYPQDDDEYSL